jgi:hypothetical protein
MLPGVEEVGIGGRRKGKQQGQLYVLVGVQAGERLRVLGTELGRMNLRTVARAPLHVHASQAHRIPLPTP